MENQEELAKKLMNLALGRVYKTLHEKLGLEEKKEAERIFESGSDAEKEKLIKKHLPNFEQAYKEELARLEEELKNEM